MIAIKRLQNILWIIIVAFGALTAYLISLRVATERNAAEALDQRIRQVRADIRYLEIEYEARTNMRQLEQWNSQVYRYIAPQSAQYLPDERALAHLERVEPNGELYIAPPVMMAMADDAPQLSVAAAPITSPASTQIRESAPSVAPVPVAAPAVSTPVRTAAAEPVAKPAPKPSASPVARLASVVAKPSSADDLARRSQRMAMLDGLLLDDRTLRDIGAQAAAERGGKVR